MQTFLWDELSRPERQAALSRPTAISDTALIARVASIMDDVKENGDAALLKYTQRFDCAQINDLRVSAQDIENAWNLLPEGDKSALRTAKANIETFHGAQAPKNISVETMTGVMCRREARALESAGLYVPGGTAPLVSTLLMLAVPAKIAGVERRIVITPPGSSGQIHPAILAAAYLADVTAIYACGGAQAIAALTYGTETIPKCDKIFGPGNAYVAAAKSLAAQIAGGPGIDLPAGPSEAMVVADDKCNPTFVASDLLSQAEHDTLAQVICVCKTKDIAAQISSEIDRQVATLPRQDIARDALEHARIIITQSREEYLDIINQYAPEHLILQIENPEDLVPRVRNAGSIFLGPWTPESVGDYASGTNHTLPTNGAARAYSGVTLESFIKYISIQSLTSEGLKNIGPTVERLAELEGLDAHKRAVSLRLESLL